MNIDYAYTQKYYEYCWQIYFVIEDVNDEQHKLYVQNTNFES